MRSSGRRSDRPLKMLFPTTFAALSVSLLLGAPAAANGLSHKYTSPEDPLGPAKHVTMTKIMVKKFIDFPAGGSTCDRAGHSSILFTRSEIQGALTSMASSKHRQSKC